MHLLFAAFYFAESDTRAMANELHREYPDAKIAAHVPDGGNGYVLTAMIRSSYVPNMEAIAKRVLFDTPFAA